MTLTVILLKALLFCRTENGREVLDPTDVQEPSQEGLPASAMLVYTAQIWECHPYNRRDTEAPHLGMTAAGLLEFREGEG